MAEWDTAYINDLPDSAFAYIEPGGEKDGAGKTTPRSLRHFPHHNAAGDPDAPHVRNAKARIPQSALSAAAKSRALGHVDRHAEEMGIGEGEASEELSCWRERAEPVQVRDAEGDAAVPMLFGHFSVFDEWAEIDSLFEGHFMERIAPGAFARTFSEDRSRMRVLFNHGRDTLGLQQLGSIKTLDQDDLGARYEVQLNEGIPPLLMSGLRKGQYGSSFRFVVARELRVERPRPSTYNPRALPERTVTEARVREFGPATFPVYIGATASVRSATDEAVLDWLRREPELTRSLLNLRVPGPRATERRDEPTPFKNTKEFIECLKS